MESKRTLAPECKHGRCGPVAGQVLPPLQLAAPFGHVAVLRPQSRHGDLQLQPLLDDAEPHAVEPDGVRRRSAHVLGVGALESILHRGTQAFMARQSRLAHADEEGDGSAGIWGPQRL